MAQLRRINFDSTWLLTLPSSNEFLTKTCNLLIDPWLSSAEQIDMSISFSGQKRIVPALASSIGELEEYLSKEETTSDVESTDQRPKSNKIDGIVISHPFSDHLHPETLTDERVAERIPIFVTEDAESALLKLIGKTKRSHKVIVIGKTEMKVAPKWIEENCVKGKIEGLPNNVDILQALPQEKLLFLQGPAGMAWKKLHGGLIFMWKDVVTNLTSETKKSPQYNSLIYSPHGITSASIPNWLTNGKFHFHHWAIMTMFDRLTLPFWLSGPVNLGLAEPLKMIQPSSTYPARFVIDTHGEHKEMRGLVARLLRRYWLNSDQIINGYDPDREAKRVESAQEIIDHANSALDQPFSKAMTLQVGESLSLS